MNSTHVVEVVPVTLEKHPNADSLSIVKVHGYTVCCKTEDWIDKKIAAYIPPDNLVDVSRKEFEFLRNEAKYNKDCSLGATYARITAKKIRKVVSYGLLIPAPEGAKIGDDVASVFGIEHYERPLSTKGGEVASGPALYTPKYDVDSFLRYGKEVFVEGEPVFVTEKIHGANGRWVFHKGQLYCGSRTEWKKEYTTPPKFDYQEVRTKLEERFTEEKIIEEGWPTTYIDDRLAEIEAKIKQEQANPTQNLWWKALKATPALEKWIKEYPDAIVYGEVYGQVQNLKYGTNPGEVRIAVFDILTENWIDAILARLIAPELPWVPTIGKNIAFDFESLVSLANGHSLIKGANHHREGIVISPIKERTHPKIGRVKLKAINPKYLEKDE